MIEKYKKPLKFLISGGCAAVLEYTIFYIMTLALGSRYLIVCQSVSFLSGATVSFTLNKFWVFRSAGEVKTEAVRYFLLVILNLAISNLVLWFIVNVLGIISWQAKIVTMAGIAVWNFLILQKIVFKKAKSPTDNTDNSKTSKTTRL